MQVRPSLSRAVAPPSRRSKLRRWKAKASFRTPYRAPRSPRSSMSPATSAAGPSSSGTTAAWTLRPGSSAIRPRLITRLPLTATLYPLQNGPAGGGAGIMAKEDIQRTGRLRRGKPRQKKFFRAGFFA